MKKGLFISVEGPDGSGKSTQIKNIRQFFKDKGMGPRIHKGARRNGHRRTDTRCYP